MWDQAYNQLREALFAGHFPPGSLLSLRSLADRFGTSITPVRDAVSRLIAQGILKSGARNAALVPVTDIDAFRDLTVVRCRVEGLAAREAATKATTVEVTELAQTLDRMRHLIREREMSLYLSEHRRFHFQIYEMASNPVLREVIDNLWLRCGPVLSYVVPTYVQSLKGTDHHMAILEAIKRSDAETAETEVVADIMEASEYLIGLADRKGHIGAYNSDDDGKQSSPPNHGSNFKVNK
jgi:DNA-binding GntR family transcriptional regulator